MASFVVDNNVESTVADNPLTQAATTLNVATGEGANFPSTFPFRLTIWDDSTYPDPTDDSGMEIVECTARSTDALTIARGKEGTGDVAHALGERVAILITAGLFNDATYGIITKLDGIESGAAADQTGSEIKTLYEGEANAYTDTKDTKLTGIDTGADVTGSNPPQNHVSRHEAGGDDPLIEYTLSDDVLLSHDAEVVNFHETSYVKKKTITLSGYVPDTMRISFALDIGGTAPHTTYGRIYRNGGAVGTERTISATGYTTYTEDIAGWVTGDTLELWCKVNEANDNGYAKEFRTRGKEGFVRHIMNGANT